MYKRIWGIMMAMILVFTSIDLSVMAMEKESVTEDIDAMESIGDDKEIIEEEGGMEVDLVSTFLPVSGKIENDTDEGITWKIDVNGNLTVSGKGEINTQKNYGMTYDKIPWYEYCTSIITADINLSDIKDISFLFYKCENLVEVDFSDFNTSDVVKMSCMFQECSSLENLDLSHFYTSNVINMTCMFYKCTNLENLDISNFDTSQVVDMIKMFAGCERLKTIDISGFNTSNVTSMRYMFYNCKSLERLDISNFDTSSLTDMGNMFWGCENIIDLKLGDMELQNLIYMDGIFGNCKKITSLDLLNLDTENVTEMEAMFQGCCSLKELDLSGLDTINVQKMWSMFWGCESLTELNLSGFNTSNVLEMDKMFQNCSELAELDLSSFNMGKVESTSDMLAGCGKLTSIKTPVNILSGQFIELPLEEGYAWYLPDWTSTSILPEEMPTSAVLTKNSIESVEGNKKSGVIEIDGGKIKWEINLSGELTVTGSGEVFSSDTEIEDDENCYAEQLPWYEYRELIKSASIMIDGITNVRSFLYDCYNLTSVDVSGFDTSQVSDMSSMFAFCENLEEVIFTVEGQEGKFVTSSVLDMSNMFSGCGKLRELNLSNFNTGNVINMSGMFSGCSSITYLDISNFITSKVTDMSGMFEMCSKLEELNIENFDTSNATSMWALFAQCSSLATLDVSNFNTSMVTDMDGMFGDCNSLETLDLSSFDMKNVISADEMLGGCSNLKEINTPINIIETTVIELPSEDGYVWHMPETGVVTILPTGLTENITLTRKSKVELDTQTYTVTFNSMGGSAVDDQEVEKNGFIIKPEIPRKEGFTLCGWSVDETFTEDWDFENDIVQGNMMLYARWEENVLDKETTDTGICVEILAEDSYVYTGKGIMPKVRVWDTNRLLTQGVDYKVSYKNNVNACDHTSETIKDSKKPQVIIQGIGNYKSTYKTVKHFSIKQADMAELDITVPLRVAAKSKNKLQKISPVVKTEKVKIATKNYVVSYYTDETLANKVNGITTPGLYYITVEAKKNKENIYSGNFKGVSKPFEIRVTEVEELLDKAKVSIGKNLVVNLQTVDADTAIRTVITQLKIGNSTYKTTGDALNEWKQYFEISATDYDGSAIGQDDFYKILHSAGTKTVVIRAIEGKDKNHIGERTVKITVKGTKLKKEMFKLSYGSMADKIVLQTDYTAYSMVPMIYTELERGKDYQLAYKRGKNTISEEEVVNAGTYTAVISGINQYSGSISVKFTIKKVNLATAYKNGKITIVNDKEPVEQSLAGVGKEITVSYDADGNDDMYSAVDLTNADYKVAYKNNKKVSANGKTAYISLTGKGNFEGTLKGDGKTENTGIKNGIAKELNYFIGLKNINSKDIQVLVKGLVSKKSKITGAKIEVYDRGKKLSSSEYIATVSEDEKLIITAKERNYSGSKTITLGKVLGRVSDSKKVKISYKQNQKYYYNGTSHQPELNICDREGNDISDCCIIEYGENIRVGKGTITVTGKTDKGYYDKKVLKFTILPKWMQWILG